MGFSSDGLPPLVTSTKSSLGLLAGFVWCHDVRSFGQDRIDNTLGQAGHILSTEADDSENPLVTKD